MLVTRMTNGYLLHRSHINVGYTDDQWVLASQITHVLYVADLAKKTKHVVVPGKQDIIGVDGINDVED